MGNVYTSPRSSVCGYYYVVLYYIEFDVSGTYTPVYIFTATVTAMAHTSKKQGDYNDGERIDRREQIFIYTLEIKTRFSSLNWIVSAGESRISILIENGNLPQVPFFLFPFLSLSFYLTR